jgi:hypothetical protein
LAAYSSPTTHAYSPSSCVLRAPPASKSSDARSSPTISAALQTCSTRPATSPAANAASARRTVSTHLSNSITTSWPGVAAASSASRYRAAVPA